jgi:cation:H+ antiporter
VVYCGTKLAVYGDALAELTGLGRLFVGSILVALATSLPELSTNISAVSLNPPNPAIAIGNVFGANMINLFTFGAVALVFGGSRFLSNVSVEQKYLVFIAILMTVVGLLFISVPLNASAFNIGLPAGIILIMYVLGMWFIYKKKPDDENSGSDEIQTTLTLTKAWLLFGVVSAGVVVGGIFLAISTDQIADITGISSGVLGIIAVSIVTTMPEASATIAAARMKAYDLGVAGLFGSCVFNVTIIGYADIFYRDGIITTQGEPAHQIAGLVAVGLMLIGLAVILGKNKLPKPVLTAGVAAIVVVYLVGAVLVATNG